MKDCCKNYLNEQFGGDEEIIGEIYAEYVASLGVKIAEAKDALAKSDWSQLDKAAHTIKGNALAAGDTDMADKAIALRNVAKLQSADTAAGYIADLEKLSTLL